MRLAGASLELALSRRGAMATHRASFVLKSMLRILSIDFHHAFQTHDGVNGFVEEFSPQYQGAGQGIDDHEWDLEGSCDEP